MSQHVALTNGSYATTISAAGGGGSNLGELQLTRWRQDLTTDADGWFLYLRDLDSGALWSASHLPVRHPADRCTTQMGADRAVIIREDADIVVRTDVVVARNADLECRRYTITNSGATPLRLQLTTYAEVALATADADAGHPAFSKLFIQTAHVVALGAVVASRRPRNPDEPAVHLIHALMVPQEMSGDALELETDRLRFIGRGRTTANPVALDAGHTLSATTGDVLDPVLALRRVIELPAGATVRVYALLAAGYNRDALESLIAGTSRDNADTLFRHLGDLPDAEPVTFSPPPVFRPAPRVDASAPTTEPLQYFNGFGGFTAAGTEYVIRIDSRTDGLAWPPLPWANVVASETAGFVATEAGPGFTWSGNSRLNRLTPWSNDPVSDPQGEAIYLRDDDRGDFWSPTPAPV
ncbi:MAG: glycosyl transferase, partial [Gemmatimonas sp.]